MIDAIETGIYDSQTGESLSAIHVEDVSPFQQRSKVAKLVYMKALAGPIVQLNMDGGRIHYFYESAGGRKMIDEDTKRFGFQPGELMALVTKYAPEHEAA